MDEILLLSYSSPDVHQPQPWPVAINDNGSVRSGLGPDDGAYLIGFGPAGEQHVTVWLEEAWNNPGSLVGMTATFVNDGGMFLWNHPVAEAKRMPQS